MRLDATHHKHVAMLRKGHLSTALEDLYRVCERLISARRVSLTLRDTVEQNQQDSWERDPVRAEGEQDKKRGRIQRGGWRKKRSRRNTRGPIDFRASLVFFCSLNCCPHSTFPLSHLSVSHRAKRLVSSMHAGPLQWGGGVRRVEVEVLTVPVGDQIICDTVSPFLRCSPV